MVLHTKRKRSKTRRQQCNHTHRRADGWATLGSSQHHRSHGVKGKGPMRWFRRMKSKGGVVKGGGLKFHELR